MPYYAGGLELGVNKLQSRSIREEAREMYPAKGNEALYVQKLCQEHEDVEAEVHCELVSTWSRKFSPGERRPIQYSTRQGNFFCISPEVGHDSSRKLGKYGMLVGHCSSLVPQSLVLASSLGHHIAYGGCHNLI